MHNERQYQAALKAVREWDEKALRKHLRGLDIHTNDDELLYTAVTNENSAYGSDYREVMNLLLLEGANPKARNNELLKIAALNGRYQIAYALKNFGATIEPLTPAFLEELKVKADQEMVRLLCPLKQEFKLEADFVVSTRVEYGASGVGLTKVFDFNAKEILYISDDRGISVIPFGDNVSQQVSRAREAMKDLYKSGAGMKLQVEAIEKGLK